MKHEFTLSLKVRPEARAILERLAAVATEEKKGEVSVEETAATVLEVGIRALAEQARGGCDARSQAMRKALLGA